MRVIVAHLHAISARLHFCTVVHGEQSSVCLPQPLAPLSTFHEHHQPRQALPHPAQLIRPAAAQLGLEADVLSVASPLLGWVESPGEWVPVALLRIKGNDLPQLTGARFITLMDLLQLPVVERLLLRKAYEALLEG